MPLKRKKIISLRVAVFGDEKTFIPVITPQLTANNCQIIPVDVTLSPLSLRELQIDLCIVDLAEPALAAHIFMRRLPDNLPIIAVIDDAEQVSSFPEIFDVLARPLDLIRLSEDLDYLQTAACPCDPTPLPPVDAEIEQFSEFLSEQCGLHFDRRNRKNLERGIQRRMTVVAAPSVAAYFLYLKKFLESRQEFKKLVSLLTIGETSFFRFDPHFAALIEQVMPELIKQQQATRRLRIWSAGCSTGEEVYSLAITLLQHFPQLDSWEVTILGTDISQQSLTTARAGIYSGRTLRHVAPEILKKWFVDNNGSWTVADRLRQFTRFSFLNLQSETYPSPKNGTTECDLIFCRNVMIYFRPETVRAVVSRLRRGLRPGGYLFLGHAETLGRGFLDFVRCQHLGGIYYRAGDDVADSSSAVQPPQDKNKKQPQFVLYENTANTLLFAATDGNENKNKGGVILDDKVNNKTLSSKFSIHGPASEVTERLLLEQGFALADQGRLDEAFSLCQQILQKNDLSSRGYFLRGIIHDQRMQNLEAAEDFQRVILLDLKATMAHYHLAHVYRRVGRKSETLRSLQTVVRLLAKMREDDAVPDAQGWTVSGLRERCGVELTQLEK